jgi:hypothetical protein
MEPETEFKLLSKHLDKVYGDIHNTTDLRWCKRFLPHIELMIKVANESRKSAMNNSGFDRPISLRGLKRWVTKCVQYKDAPNPIKVSLGEAITNGYPESLKVAIVQFCTDVFGEDYSK